MKEYKYQLHIHTTPCSACGQMSPGALCKALHEYGYQGAVLTNHFYHGNTGIDRNLPWHDFVSSYEKDYLDCLKEAEKYDLDIIFGIEEVVVPGLEILCYGITSQILYDNPQLQNCSLEKFVEIMRKNGVVLIQAHPFREADYIPNPGHLPVELIDGVEVYNKGNSTKEMNQKALDLATKHPHLIKTSSGDVHWTERIPFGGIITNKRIKDSKELAEALRSGSYQLIIPKEELWI